MSLELQTEDHTPPNTLLKLNPLPLLDSQLHPPTEPHQVELKPSHTLNLPMDKLRQSATPPSPPSTEPSLMLIPLLLMDTELHTLNQLKPRELLTELNPSLTSPPLTVEDQPSLPPLESTPEDKPSLMRMLPTPMVKLPN